MRKSCHIERVDFNFNIDFFVSVVDAYQNERIYKVEDILSIVKFV